MRLTLFLILIVTLFSCAETLRDDGQASALENPSQADSIQFTKDLIHAPCDLEDTLKAQGLVNIQNYSPSILVHLRYSTENNFIKTDAYGCLNKAYAFPKTAIMLAEAQKALTEIDSSLCLYVWDAVRPRRIQQVMWDALDLPFEERIKYVSNPKNGSIHNYGCAVDLTLSTRDGVLLDMGTDFDHFGREAHVRGEWQLVADGTLTKTQLNNRQLLRKVMRKAGFTSISSEWWHFNAMSRSAAKLQYAIVE